MQLSFAPEVLVNQKDIVFTPDDVARDVVIHFNPRGFCLDPCKGDGAFLQYLPKGSEWCEIREGKDFFDYRRKVDWIVSNPPYSIFAKWLRHSFMVADNIVYVIPIVRNFVSSRILADIAQYGGIKEIYVIDDNAIEEWSVNFAIGAVHYQRGFTGGTKTTFRNAHPTSISADRPSSALQSTKSGGA